MLRLRTIVAAVGVMLVLGGPLAPAFAATAQEGSGAVGIDATGDTDVTADLQALFDRTPDGGVVELESGADYRVEGTLVLEERHDLTIEGNGARIFATTTADRDRSHLRIVGGFGFDIRNLEIEGANPNAGLDERAYVADLEGQHGIRLEGVTDVELEGVNIHDTYGDLVLVGRHEDDRRWTEQVWIHDSAFARTGRQGIAIVAGRDIVIEHNSFTDMSRATVDLEPTARSWGAENVHILDNEVGPGRLLFVAAAGAGPVNRVVIARNTLQGRELSFWMLAEDSARRRHAWVVDNTTDTPTGNTELNFRRVDGVIVHGNRQPLRGNTPLVKATDSCDVAVTDNDIAPGTRTLEGKSRKCNFILPVEPPAPPPVAGRGQEEEASASATPTTTTPPTTEAPSTTTPPTTPTTETTPSTPTSAAPTPEGSDTDASLAAASRPANDGVAIPVVVLAIVLSALAGAGGAWAVNARRGRRDREA